MRSYFIEGLYVNRQGMKKARQRGDVPQSNVEPYAKAIWAVDVDEAMRIATEELDGGLWVEGPKVSKTEEQRMRDLGAPELPGLGFPE